MISIKPSQIFSNQPINPDIKNSADKITQPADGFGFSNLRIEPTLPDTINRTSSDFQLESQNQYSLPIRTIEHERHANFLFREHYKDYKIIDEKNVEENYVYLDIIKTIQERNPLIDCIFSKKNLDHLQKLIIEMVKFQSDGLYNISRQEDNELLTVMRSIYITTPSNPYASGPTLLAEVCKINKNILDWVVPNVIIKIQQYLGYVRDQGTLYEPIRRPEFMASSGTRINKGFDVNFV